MLNTWQEWVGTETGVVLSTALALPVAALVVPLLALLRRSRGVARPWRISLADVGLVYGTLPWVWLLLLPGENAGSPGKLSLVPLNDLFDLAAKGERFQIIGNMLVFAALGFFGPLRFAALQSVWRVLALAAGCSAFLEITQFAARLDRVSSVDDVLLNATGAALAAVLSWPWWRAKTPSTPQRAGSRQADDDVRAIRGA
ncbi:VanZ family protein [Lentzea jiangxiensis]|uniref:VanZ family protein n=1 Tax=Lentzea jiangxiensis TaxID=641025 RepID=UPI001FE1CE3E|nr:VanZ family protein [Lentzea jiangxiensis]